MPDNLTPATEPWTADALCAETDPELFFPEIGRADVVNAARGVCARCPVHAECLAEAMARRLWHDGSGIWGGMTPRERRALATAARRAA